MHTRPVYGLSTEKQYPPFRLTRLGLILAIELLTIET